MSFERVDSESIGPQLSLSEVDFPPELGERFRTLYGTDEPPADGAEWVDQMQGVIASVRGRQPTVDDLCTTPDGEHVFVSADGNEGTSNGSEEPPDGGEGASGGSEERYICVLDPLAYPFLTGETGTVRSTTPVRGETVSFGIGEDGLTVSHDEAVVSLGVSDHVETVADAPVEAVYRQVCGYIQTFADRPEYEDWAADAEAETIALSAPAGVAVAREIARTLFEEGGDSRN